LAATQHRLRSIIDDQQTTYEELKAANEEILSSNEELHSTNEELETAKEELHSANEELTTVNDELNNRNAYLDALNNDLNNVLAGIEIPVLLLQKDHRVRRFTPAAGKVLNLIPGDLGRPIGDIRFKIDMPDLDELIEETVRELRIIRREVRDRDGKWYLLSIRPYRTADDKITGTLLALLDIDEFKKAVTLAEDARDYAEAITETVREPLVVLDPKLRIVSANSSFHRAFGYSPADTRDQMFFDLSGGAWNAPKLRELLLDILPKSNELSDFEVEQVFPKTGERRLLLNARQIYRKGVGSQFILLAIEDVTDRRNAEEALIERERTIRALLNSTSQAILAVDGEGKISFHNLGAEHMFGYSSSELMNMLVEELIPERHRAAHVTHRAKYLAAPKVRAMGTGLELMGRRKDGTEFPIDVGLSSVDNSHGPMAVAFVEDITSLQKATTELRALTARLISVQESNNRVLARELHDDFTQKLAALSMDVTTLANQQPTSADALRKSLSHMAEQLGKTAADIHQFSRQIHPSVLEDLGLPAALKAECAAFSEQHTTGCEFIAESVPALIPEDIALCLYRIAQEALRNVGKHSEAERVEVRLTGHDDEVELAVVDFGNGFDLDKVKTEKGLGLVSMEERARMVNGEFSITSQEGQGTSVVVRVPLSRS
jgi:two-component system CheB/CheR fusion protein